MIFIIWAKHRSRKSMQLPIGFYQLIGQGDEDRTGENDKQTKGSLVHAF